MAELDVTPVQFRVRATQTARVGVVASSGSQVILVPMPGTQGPPGVDGDSFDGTAWWTGQGPPDVVVGAKPGDYYVDTLTGSIYKLGD